VVYEGGHEAVRSWLPWTLIQGSNACNVLVGVLLARALSPDDFGRFATMSASLAIYSALLNPLINELAHSWSHTPGVSVRALGRRTVWVSLGGILLSVGTCYAITTSALESFLILIALPLSVVAWSWMMGFLIGRDNMRLLGIAQGSGALLRLVIVMVVATVSPTLLAIAAAYVSSFLLMSVVATPAARGARLHDEGALQTNWRLVVGFFLLAAPFSLDQPLIQLWFPDISGNYAAIMTYAKSIMLLASPGLTIAYGSTLRRRESHVSPVTLIRICVFVVAIGGVFWLFRSLLFPLLLGPRYVDLIPFVSYAVLAIGCHVIAYAIAQVQLARSSPWLTVALVIPPLVQALCLGELSAPSLDQLSTVALCVFTIQVGVVFSYDILSRKLRHL